MSWSATELQITACCYLVADKKWEAAMKLRDCRLDYEEKNDTAYITITAPPDSYKMLEVLNEPEYIKLYCTPDNLDPHVSRLLLEDELIARCIYRTFMVRVLDPIEGTPTTLQVRIREAEQPEQDLLQKFMEKASTRALGWILEQHCRLKIKDSILEIVFHSKHCMAHELLHEDDTLQTLHQMAHSAFGREIAVRIIDAPADEALAKAETEQLQKPDTPIETPAYNQCRQFDNRVHPD